MRTVILSFLALTLGLISTAIASTKPDPAAEAMMKKSDCFACHQTKMKIVGPSFRDIAKKYKGNKKAPDLLVKKVKDGGAGNWGQVAMAAHPNLKDAEVKAMVQWILAQK